MEDSPTLERLQRLLESEEASQAPTAIPADTYIKLASYAQKLRAIAGSDDPSGRLAKKQLWLIEMMSRRLLQLRLSKVPKEGGSDEALLIPSKNLLPEERYVEDASQQFGKRGERFVRALADGQSSFFALAQRKQMQRMTTVRISKRVGEIMGADLKKYGPFEVNDVARLPWGNAQVMVASRQAVPVSSDSDEY